MTYHCLHLKSQMSVLGLRICSGVELLAMRCQVGKTHLLFTYMAIIFSLMDVIFYHIGTI